MKSLKANFYKRLRRDTLHRDLQFTYIGACAHLSYYDRDMLEQIPIHDLFRKTNHIEDGIWHSLRGFRRY